MVPDSRVRLGFVGDVMLGRGVDRAQQTRPLETVWGGVLPRLNELDGLFVNLECCLSTRGSPWRVTYRPFHFRGPPDRAVPALQAAGVDWCALANNHVLDYGEVALRDTLTTLEEADVAYAGAGLTREAARRPSLVEVDGLSVGLFSFTDNTPEYAADATTPGTAHVEFDLDDAPHREVLATAVSRVRDRLPDVVVASLHWGPNMRAAPPERFQAVARWLVDAGVDVVHGHSAHVFQGVEVYEGRPILYDTGDFVDDYVVHDRLRNDRSFLFEVQTTASGRPVELRLYPTQIDDCAVRPADESTLDWYHDRMQERSREFGTGFRREGRELVVALG
jgi:poly-gamma-glutamate synthesis protein (capsule biosynthesis protein)